MGEHAGRPADPRRADETGLSPDKAGENWFANGDVLALSGAPTF
jgi:hypothetical protein